MDFVIEIKKIINFYGQIQTGFQDIDRLITARRKLSTLSFNLAEFVGEQKQELDKITFSRKLAFAKAKDRIIENQKISAAAADEKARIEVEELAESEANFNGTYSLSKLLLHQTNEVLSTMNQHISYLKEEKKSVVKTQT